MLMSERPSPSHITSPKLTADHQPNTIEKSPGYTGKIEVPAKRKTFEEVVHVKFV